MAQDNSRLRVEVFMGRESQGYMWCTQKFIDEMRDCGYRVRVIQ